jgi:HAD superfamily hydrolase (TIGR01509 family)
MPSPFKAVLFDHDGTLVDSEAVHYGIWAKVLAPYGLQLTLAQYELYYAGVPTSANALDLVARYGVAEDPVTLEAVKNKATLEYLQQSSFPLMPGVRAALALLGTRGLRMAVVTGTKTFAVASSLRAHALTEWFETVVSSDDVRLSKPAPDCYLLAMERMGLQPHECVALEDTEHGVASAAAAGVACIAIPTALSEKHDFSKAMQVLPSMEAAVQWVLSGGSHDGMRSVTTFSNEAHRQQVIHLWETVFGYEAAHNTPSLAIDKKLQVQDGLFFVALVKGVVVGTILAGYDGHRGWLYSVAVHPAHRKQGHGTALIRHAERALTARGCMKINLQIIGGNEAVSGFYASLGYAIEPRVSMGKRIAENAKL